MLLGDTARLGIHTTRVSDFIEWCVQEYPNRFAGVLPHDPGAAQLELQGTQLGLNAALCIELYVAACRRYQLDWNPATCLLMRRPMTVGGLHRQLWREGNWALSGTNDEWYRPYPTS
jgi:hypothetical protein